VIDFGPVHRRHHWVAAAVLVGLAACGTPEEAAPPAAEPGDEATITATTQEGPVRATVSLSPTEPQIGDPLVLVLTVEAEPGVTVELPAFGEALGRFSIADFTPRETRTDDGGTVASQRYTLHAPSSGRQRIPPLRIEFIDERSSSTTADFTPARELLTDELKVKVASLLPDGAVIEDMRPLRAELDETFDTVPARWPWLLALVAGAAILPLLWLRLRERLRRRARLSAYDRALGRLHQLEGRGLPSGGDADGWYVELSSIVRHYLEDRYGVRAPELTTEEFLREARRSGELSSTHRDMLSHFLDICDRVKFAAYVPAEAESREALTAARRFLDETRLRAAAGRAAADVRPAA